MSVRAKILHQAEAELDFLKKTREEECACRKREFYKKCERAKQIDAQLSRTAIDAAKAVLAGANAKKLLTKMKDENLLLQGEMRGLLIAANLPANYLEVKYSCKKCRDTGYVDGIMCGCLKDRIKKIAYNNLNRLSPLALSTFESFDVNFYPDQKADDGVNIKLHMEKVLRFCREYAKNFDEGAENLFLQGATGLGKTHLSLAIANDVIERGYNVIYASAPNIIAQLEKEHFDRDAEGDETKGHLVDCDLLILDDLGTEFQTSFSSATIYNIINSRIMYKKPTIISTNLSVKEIQAAYSKRLVSRIMGDYKRLFFLGNDIRQALKFPKKLNV